MYHDPASEAAAANEGPVLNLPLVLNILYRGRLLVLSVTLLGVVAGAVYGLITTPLYMATMQVRPGIVAYSDAGGPVREWALKDIVYWFRSGLYGAHLSDDPLFGDTGAPPITAEFIPTGPQFTRGGDIITLTVYDVDPGRASSALTLSVEAFNGAGQGKGEGTTIALTRGGARIRMAKLNNDLERIEAAAERNQLLIGSEERELARVEAEIALKNKRIERLAGSRDTYLRAAATTAQEIATGRARLIEVDSLLQVALAVETGRTTGADGRVGDNDPVTEMLLQTANREHAARVGELLGLVSSIESHLAARTIVADTLRDGARRLEFEMAEARLERDVTLVNERADAEQEIADLRIDLDRELPYQRAQLTEDLEAEQVRLDLIMPLETVGDVNVSERPVRPRKLRAVAILGFLALAGGMFLVFVREYFRRNREAILAGPPTG